MWSYISAAPFWEWGNNIIHPHLEVEGPLPFWLIFQMHSSLPLYFIHALSIPFEKFTFIAIENTIYKTCREFLGQWRSIYRALKALSSSSTPSPNKILGRTDGQMDGVTALLDLLSPSATQVKRIKRMRKHEEILEITNLHHFQKFEEGLVSS